MPESVNPLIFGPPGRVRTSGHLARSQVKCVVFAYESVACGACPSDAAVDLSITYSSLAFQVCTNLAQSVLPLTQSVHGSGIVARRASRYTCDVIQSFAHKGLQRFYDTGTTVGIQPSHRKKLRLQLTALGTAQTIEDMDLPGFRLHRLKGKRAETWAIGVSGNWRLTFRFEDGQVYDVNYEDYH